MKDYDLSSYGESIADVYDEWMRPIGPAAAVAALAQLAGEGPVLELGVGTGRLALPLAERGLEVHGIDASEAMLAKLREKPGGERLPTSVGSGLALRERRGGWGGEPFTAASRQHVSVYERPQG